MSEDTDFKVATDQEAKLSETITHSAVRKKGKQKLDVQPVVMVDPDTGELIGASNFFPTHNYVAVAHGVVVQNQWYTVLEAENVVVQAVVTQLGVSDETVEYKITIDGEAWTRYAAIALAFAGNNITGIDDVIRLHGGNQIFTMYAASAIAPVEWSTSPGWWLRGRDIKIEVRKTTAAGAATLTSYVVYQQF